MELLTTLSQTYSQVSTASSSQGIDRSDHIMTDDTKFEDIVSDSQLRNGGKQVCKNDFQMLSVIGKGSYGKVLLVRKKACGQLYAIKVLKKSEIQRRNQVERTMTERRILGQVRHPFVVKMDYAF